MSELNIHILRAASTLPEGGLLTPKEFLHLGSREAVDQSFTRLTRDGKLLRVGRGLYTRPVKGRFGTRLPSTEKVLEALAVKSEETIVEQEAAAANLLGLSTQVPVQEIYLTSGRGRTLRLGKRDVILKPAPRWMLLLGHRPGGTLIRALAWLGAEKAQNVMPELMDKIPSSEWEAVAAVRSELPGWLAKTVGQAAPHA